MKPDEHWVGFVLLFCHAERVASHIMQLLFIWTQDPNTNRIAQWLDVAPRQGIVDLSFQLAPEATLGTYTVTVAEGKTFSTFSVEEYGRWGTKTARHWAQS